MINAFAFIGVMLLIGMILRAKIPFLKNMLIPASVLAGIVGFILLNLNLFNDLESTTFTDIVNILFTLSFISIGLTSTKSKEKGSVAKKIARGSIGMGTIWCILYAITPVFAVLFLSIFKKIFNINPLYGLMVQFGFAQGPGQATTFGTIIEQYGYKNAAMVGVTFAAMGFISAFLVGVLIIKKAIKKGLIKDQTGNIEIKQGYYNSVNKKEPIGYATTYGGNIETLSFVFSIMGLCYFLALVIAKIFSYLPGFLGTGMSGMMFMNGLFAAYIVKFVLKKLKLDYMLDSVLQSKITGFLTDFVVASSFMSIRINAIGNFIIPILLISIITTFITFVICIVLGRRLGDNNDFERTVGLFGTCTGTVPSGVALVRIIDPSLSDTTSIELGMMNLPMLLCTPVYILILACASGSISIVITIICLIILAIVYFVCLRLFKCFNKPTYNWKEEK
jgi:ESS family glutamate:Na+ symporter